VLTAFVAQDSVVARTNEPAPQVITYTVQAGDTLTRIANRYGVTVADLVAWNDIANPDLIEVGQQLIIHVSEDWAQPTFPPSAPPTAAAGPLAFTWSTVDWRPDDPNYVATVRVTAQGGQPPYTFYHDGLVQPADTFEIEWRRCRPKPGSVGVSDAAGTYVKEDYWLLAPYCPTGVEILEPEEGAQLKQPEWRFNVIWQATTDPAPALYGMEVEVWMDGDWQPFKSFEGFSGDLFLVDGFPGDLAGRVRMWGIYEGKYAGPKTPWRTFEFRVTY
jgi:LysM repeat protein